jgi:hypothetical protein
MAPEWRQRCVIGPSRLWAMPVVVGFGQRLFEDVDASGLDLSPTGERRMGNGSGILTYVPG